MSAGSHTRPLLLGHRGCRIRRFHENTLTAFDHAIRSGCDGFELDVRATLDGVLVCLHDPIVSKAGVKTTTYDSLSNQYIKNCRGRVLPWHRKPIPSSLVCLPEVLERFSQSVFLDIELKDHGMEEAVASLMAAHPPAKGYVVSSFLPEVLSKLKDLTAGVMPLGFIFDHPSGIERWASIPAGWIIPRHDLVSKNLVASVHAAGRMLMTWTVNRPSDMSRLAAWGVDGLVSDDPMLLSRTILGR